MSIWIPLAALGALWLVLCRHLSTEWSLNDQYSYGWFVPIFAAYLFWLRWEDRPEPLAAPETPTSKLQPPGKPQTSGPLALTTIASLLLLFLLLPVRVLEIANPDWRLVSWAHALTVVSLTLIYIWYIGGTPWLRHFTFPVIFTLVAIPWVSPIEEPVVQNLMRLVAAIAAETLNLFGVPAVLEGNVISLNGRLIGVNEACSGVRSLQTSIMIGLLFGELKRLTTIRRLTLLAGAVAIAFVANCFRAIFLVSIAASHNAAAVEKWHDTAGYGIVALVFLGTLLLARLLSCSTVESRKAEVENEKQTLNVQLRNDSRAGNPTANVQLKEAHDLQAGGRHSSFIVRHLGVAGTTLAWLVFVEIATAGWYRMHEGNLVPGAQWSVRWPEAAPGLRDIQIDERTKRILRFDQGRGMSWRSKDETTAFGNATELLYFFRWQPGRNSAILSSAHRPDVCLPASGWQQLADHGSRIYTVTPELRLLFRHFEFKHPITTSTAQWAHTFFSISEDLIPSNRDQTIRKGDVRGERATWTRSERVQMALEGRRNLGQQVLQLAVISRTKVPSDQVEADFARMLPQLIIVPESPPVAAR